MITLVLGGTRSGKSAVAERLASAAPQPVVYVATARLDPDDDDHAARIAGHRQRRPDTWRTVECPEPAALPEVLRATAGTVIVDSLGTWVTAHPGLVADPTDLVAALRSRRHDTVVVSEEVGLAPHAPTELGRRFVDQLGTTNQRVAEVSDRVLLVVAGRVLELGPPGAPSC